MARITTRRGLSFFEIVGFLAAMVGGVVLGSMYLGVDVRSLAMSAVRFAQGDSSSIVSVATSSSAEAQPATAEAPAPAIAQAAAVAQQTPAPNTPPTAVAPANNTAPPAVPAEAQAAAEPAAAPVAQPATSQPALADFIELTDEQRQALTRAYWVALDACMKEEIEHRVSGIQESDNLQLFDYLSCRSEGHATAAKRIDELSDRGVDEHVTAYAEKAKVWHEEGAKLFGRALDLLTDAPSAQLSGPFAQSWQSAATQHRMEEKLLREKHEAVQAYLTHAEKSAAAAEPAAK